MRSRGSGKAGRQLLRPRETRNGRGGGRELNSSLGRLCRWRSGGRWLSGVHTRRTTVLVGGPFPLLAPPHVGVVLASPCAPPALSLSYLPPSTIIVLPLSYLAPSPRDCDYVLSHRCCSVMLCCVLFCSVPPFRRSFLSCLRRLLAVSCFSCFVLLCVVAVVAALASLCGVVQWWCWLGWTGSRSRRRRG